MREYIRPSERFERDIQELEKSYPRIKEVRTALMRELARNPTAGTPIIRYPNYWIFLTFPIGSMPVFRVLYTFNKDEPNPVVILKKIAPATSAFDQEDY